MTYEDNINAAHELGRQEGLAQGREEGRVAAEKQLRSFTGVAGVVPRIDQPEHVAYLAYELELAAEVERLQGSRARQVALVDTLASARDVARRQRDDELQKRQDQRADRNALIRGAGRIGDLALPEHRLLAQRESGVKRARKKVESADTRSASLSAELALVTEWIEQLFVDVETARAERTND